jgi:hypothetical protein
VAANDEDLRRELPIERGLDQPDQQLSTSQERSGHEAVVSPRKVSDALEKEGRPSLSARTTRGLKRGTNSDNCQKN